MSLVFLLSVSPKATAQIAFNLSVPAELNVCSDPEIFHVQFTNNTGNTLSGVQVKVQLPSGIVYAGGLTESSNFGVSLVSAGSNTFFSTNNIPNSGTVDFTFSAQAVYAAVAYQQGGGIFRNTVTVLYSGGSANQQTVNYNILIPALSITTVSPMANTVYAGATFTRSVTIVNGGYGKLSSFTLADIHNSGLDWLSVDKGVLNTARTEVVLGATEFQTIGDGDAFLEQNESITIVQALKSTGCNSTGSQLVAKWGCTTQTASSNSKYPYTTVQQFLPNLVMTPTAVYDMCANASPTNTQSLQITNTGSGASLNNTLKIYTYPADVYTKLLTNTVTYSINGGAVVSIAPTFTEDASAISCLGVGAKKSFTVALPQINPGQVMTVRWDAYTCPTLECAAFNQNGWKYDISYVDVCGSNNFTNNNNIGLERRYKDFSIFAENPADLADNQQGTYTFTFSKADHLLHENANTKLELSFDVPQGLLWSGNNSDLTLKNGNAVWTPQTVSYNSISRVLTATYAYPKPFNLTRAVVDLKLTASCSALNGGGWATVGFQSFYIFDAGCANPYRLPLHCKSTPMTYLHCPGVCNEGLVFNDFIIKRTSYGKADNNADGIADAANALDFNKIKLNRVMEGDTFSTISTGKVLTSANYPSFGYGYAYMEMPYGNEIALIGATVSILDHSSGVTYTCTPSISQTVAGGIRKCSFDFSPATLVANGCSAMTGFVFSNDDEIVLNAKYKVVGNIGNRMEQVSIQTNQFYLSLIANPTAASDKFQCNVWFGNFTLMGYAFYSNWSEQYDVKDCNKTINQTYYFGLGGVYGGGDMFPYEYRNWSNVNHLRVVIPAGYSLVSGSINQYRTTFINTTITETASITPTGINGQELIYNLSNLYSSGQLKYSDDGYHGVASIVIAPSCTVTDNNRPMSWYFNFKKNNFIGGATTAEYTYAPDYVRFYKGNIVVSSTLPTQDGITETVSWDISVKNSSAGNAVNGWFYPESSSGKITVLEVRDMATNTVLTSVNGFYKVGSFTSNQSKTYRVKADYNTCSLDNLKITSGYDCAGYPTNLAAFNCGINEFSLYLNPLPSELQVRIKDFPETTPCSNTTTIEVEMLSAKMGYVKDLLASITPTTPNIVISNLKVKYPSSAAFSNLATPTLVNGVYQITDDMMNAGIAANGMPGVTDVNANKLVLRFDLVTNSSVTPSDLVKIDFSANQMCGNALPVTSLMYSTAIKLKEIANVGLTAMLDSWSTSWADYDGDGNVDLYVTTHDETQPNVLYRNNGNGTFTRVLTGVLATEIQSSLASTWADYDNDGDLDVFVANNIGFYNALYRNEGNGNFVKITNDPIVNHTGYSHGAAWADYNNDGFVDLFVADYFSTKFNQLYLNNGDGTFILDGSALPSLEAASSVNGVWGDYNNDGFPDLFVSNTNDENNSLYKNNGDGTFTKITSGAIVNDGGKSVGASWGDYNNDGYLDLFVANAGAQDNFLYKNNGDGTFTKITSGAIVNDGGNSHGSAWVDIDNDGDLDMFVTNNDGTNSFMYINNGDETFTKIDNNLTQNASYSMGTAWADYDNDGDMDIYVANRDNNRDFLYQNERGSCQNKYCVSLVGSNSNASAIGTKIRVKANIYGKDIWQMREVSAQSGGGTGGQNDFKQIFGMGNANIADSVIIEWNSGYRQVLTGTSLNDCQIIVEPNASQVCGKVFFDANKNCVQDVAEVGIPNIPIVIQPGNRTLYTDMNGNYSINLELGTFTVTQGSNAIWSNACTPTSYNVNVSAFNNTYCGNDFADTTTCDRSNLYADIISTTQRIGLKNILALNYANNGILESDNTQLKFIKDARVTILESTLPWDAQKGDTLIWNIGTLAGYSKNTIYLVDLVSNTVPLNTNLIFSTAISNDAGTDCDFSDNQASRTAVAGGAFDPNDMKVSPEGEISAQTELSYKIRFENVGNQPVGRAVVVSHIPEGLNPESLVIGQVSHPYTYEVIDNKTIVWTFDRIDLEPSNGSADLGHGYINFRLQPKESVPNQTEINNFAEIIFDNNLPIITNIVSNIISESQSENTLLVYPNPTIGNTTITLQGLGNSHLGTIKSLKVFNALGQIVLDQADVYETEYTLQLDFPSGCYIVNVTDTENKQYNQRLIKK